MRHILNRIAISFLAITLLGSASAQSYNEENNLFYHAFRAPQINELNPAFFPASNTLYLTLPGLSNLRFGSPVAIGDMIRVDTTDGTAITYIDINQLISGLKRNNQIRLGFDLDLIGGGLRLGNVFLTANMRFKSNFSIGLPISTIDFLLNGNLDENGNGRNVEILSGDLFGMQLYLEASAGMGFRIPVINLTVGARAKLYYGLLNLSLDNTKITLETDDNFESLHMQAFYQVQMASAIAFKKGEDGMPTPDFNFSGNIKSIIKGFLDPTKNNIGVGFDIGAKYQLGPVAISAALLDLSTGIHWHNNVYSLLPKGGVIDTVFNGFEIDQLMSGGDIKTDSLFDGYAELFSGLAPDSIVEGGEYYYSIPTKMNIGASVSLGTMARVGLLFHGQFDRGLLTKKSANNLYDLDNYGLDIKSKNTFRYNMTLTGGVNLFNWLELIVGSSVVFDGDKIDPLNPGAGVIISPLSAAQVYLMVDYVSSMYLLEAKALNFKFGFNLLLGNGGRRRML
ncbi:MAG: DUF5723 family protein [Bacteroidales bacterium]|nr:DUF5723 family protein [Bacteroidales bacterium]